jgi:uncharacterized coiled-coil DUF342 family protein
MDNNYYKELITLIDQLEDKREELETLRAKSKNYGLPFEEWSNSVDSLQNVEKEYDDLRTKIIDFGNHAKKLGA